MPLNTILAEVAADLGIKITNEDEYIWLLGKINSAAKDLYEQNDLHGCLREQIIELDTTSQQISLPYYVFELRGLRDYDSRIPIKMSDMSPRYQTEGWTDVLKGSNFLPWRIKQQGAPTKSNWLVDGKLTVTLSKAASKDFTIK